ncbi:SDR family NAD(P)-dependent oxidoreductase [Bradyrhizobium sp. AS23.2]|uniref:SDR family NAD(P)-dependent oxidoreductase n=1 Tax=Bradyrhizobium sp. AS23.2 TaxID=1680155 RepID=UPI0009FAC028|nr:SDR family NAD(P)-dependent oxidoreductase [Bradyrhizobium sp. AS23.2]
MVRKQKHSTGRLDDKVAVITGATSGIGLRTAEVFVAEGAKIVIAGRRMPEGEALAKQLGAFNVRVNSISPGAIATGVDLVIDGAVTGGRNWSQQQQGCVALRKAFDQGT